MSTTSIAAQLQASSKTAVLLLEQVPPHEDVYPTVAIGGPPVRCCHLNFVSYSRCGRPSPWCTLSPRRPVQQQRHVLGSRSGSPINDVGYMVLLNPGSSKPRCVCLLGVVLKRECYRSVLFPFILLVRTARAVIVMFFT
jgi:hypothetical protein